MRAEYYWVLLAVLVVIADLFAVFSIRRSGANAESKAFWQVLIIWVPVFGVLIWAVMGPKNIPHSHPTHSEHRS